MHFMAVKKSRKQVLVSDLFIFKRRCIYRDTETTVILSEFTCKIVFTKKNGRIGKPSNAAADPGLFQRGGCKYESSRQTSLGQKMAERELGGNV